MADEKGSGPPNKRRRPPTTIDLKATEVASEPASSVQPVDPPAENVQPEAAAPEPEPKPEPSAESAAAETAAAPLAEPAADPRADERDRLDTSSFNARGGEGGRKNWRPIAASAAGAAAMGVLFLALWGSGAFNTRDDVTRKLAQQVAALEQQVRALSSRPQSPATDPRTLSDLTARLGAAEQAMGRFADFDARLGKAEAAAAAPHAAQPDQALSARVAGLETTARDAKSRADAAFEAAQKPPPPTVSPAELQVLSARVTALEQIAKSNEEKIARAAVTGGADRAGRLAFVTVALRGAVERGEPFGREFGAVKPLLPDAASLAPLEPFAASGVPRTAALARELSQLSAPMLSAAGAAREGGLLDRIQQNAERLVRIRPISETPGDDPATIVARAEAKASHGDLAGAAAELATLPPAPRAVAEPWIKKAQAQIAALVAARKLADDAVGTLGKAAP